MSKEEKKKLKLALSIFSGRHNTELNREEVSLLDYDWYSCVERGFPSRSDILGDCENIIFNAIIDREITNGC